MSEKHQLANLPTADTQITTEFCNWIVMFMFHIAKGIYALTAIPFLLSFY